MQNDALKGLHKVKKRLADGTDRFHYYAWRGGPRIESDFGTADFKTEFDLLHKQDVACKRAAGVPTLGRIFDGYEDSPNFKRNSPRTRSDYKDILDALRAEFGTVPISDLTVKGTRATLYDWILVELAGPAWDGHPRPGVDRRIVATGAARAVGKQDRDRHLHRTRMVDGTPRFELTQGGVDEDEHR